ncbi:MAG: divalent-cation tolerance protein CutA [Candidatus Diapherotrites archaeon]|nr:divalent-cation tolerance protein CutA [Candidatus Diapherotrites archaeon]
MIIAVTTFSTERDARIVAKTVVDEKLAACAQISKINSVYRSEGEMKDETEYKLVLKTTKEKLPALEEKVKEMHKYSMPQWVWWDAEASKEYGDWVEKS